MPGISVSRIPIPFNKGGGINWSSYWTTLKTFNMVIEGHSFVVPTSYFQRYSLLELLPITYYNEAVGGVRMSHLEDRAATVDSRLQTETSTYKNILIVWIGVNDIDEEDVGGGATTYALLKSYVTDRVAAGWKVFVYTMTPCTSDGRGAQFEIERDVFNGLLKTDLKNDQTIFVLDTDTISELDDPSDTDYYSGAIHPTEAGHILAVGLLSDKLDAISPSRNTTLTLDSPITTLTVNPTGTGDAVATLQFTAVKPTYVQLIGGAKFYTDAAGTLGETDLWVPLDQSIIYVRCTSEATMKIDRLVSIWHNWASSTNAPTLGGSIAGQTSLTNLTAGGNNTLSGSLTGMPLTRIDVRGSNTLSGDITEMTSLKLITIKGSNTLTGAVTNLTLLTMLHAEGSNTLSGDLGLNNVVNGITYLNLVGCRMNTYTAGATWSNATIYILPSAGYGYSQAEIISMLTDINNSAGGPVGKLIWFPNPNASMADTTQGGIWGDFDGETSPSDLAVAYKSLNVTKTNDLRLNGITEPGVSGDGTGFPAGFGDWYRS